MHDNFIKVNTALPMIVIEPPKIFSLSKNYEESVRCLSHLKREVYHPNLVKGKRQPISINLASIEELQPAAALVLAAELDRWRRLDGIRLQPRRLDEWSDQVLSLAHDLGLFDLLEVGLGHKSKINERLKEILHSSSIVSALQFVTGDRNTREITEKLAENLIKQVPEFGRKLTEKDDMALNTALAEASLNSVQHAYAYGGLKYPKVGNRWWAAAVYQQQGDRKYAKLFVYDQGAGIPKTLPKSTVGKEIMRIFKGRKNDDISLGWSDGERIRAALESNVSSTEKGNRGKGLPQIVKAISAVGGKLRVISGKGSVIYTKQDGVTMSSDNTIHLGGTMLEWTFSLDET